MRRKALIRRQSPSKDGRLRRPMAPPSPASGRRELAGRAFDMPAHSSPLSGPTREHLDWPFFEPAHRAYAERLDAFVADGALDDVDPPDIDRACGELVGRLGEAGLLDVAVADARGDARSIQSRLVCLTRETLAWHDGLADFAFAMQGLGSGAIGLSGSPELKAAVLPKVRAGKWIAAFALSEQEAGSDVAA